MRDPDKTAAGVRSGPPPAFYYVRWQGETTGPFDRATIERKWHEAHRRFYLRPKRIMRIAVRKDTWQRFPYYIKTAANMLMGMGDRETAAV